MKYSVCVSVEGPRFDPMAFQAGPGRGLGGEVAERKYLSRNAAADGVQRLYWKSRVISVVADRYPEDEISRLLASLEPALVSLPPDQTGRVSAQIVAACSAMDSPRGFYLSSELIRQLGRLEADIDIDFVQDLQFESSVSG